MKQEPNTIHLKPKKTTKTIQVMEQTQIPAEPLKHAEAWEQT